MAVYLCLRICRLFQQLLQTPMTSFSGAGCEIYTFIVVEALLYTQVFLNMFFALLVVFIFLEYNAGELKLNRVLL